MVLIITSLNSKLFDIKRGFFFFLLEDTFKCNESLAVVCSTSHLCECTYGHFLPQTWNGSLARCGKIRR